MTVDGALDPNPNIDGILVGGCGALIAEENVVEVPFASGGYGKPLRFYSCGATQFFANQSSAGTLNQGYNYDSSTYVPELSTNVEDDTLLAF